MVKVSVIIPVFNSENSIENTINSVVNQTLEDIEIICVNDGSDDGSLDVLNRLSNRYDFIKIVNQKNQGAAAARNNGMDNATGEYIAFLDSDDIYLDSDALQLMYDVGIKNEANMVASNIKMYNDNGDILDLPQYNDDLYCYFKNACLIDADDYGIPFYFYKNIYKTSFLKEENIIFPDLIRGEDPVFLAEILSKVNMIYGVPTNLYAFLVSSTAKAFDKLTQYQIKYDYISQYKYCFNLFEDAKMTLTSQRYKRNLFNYLKRVTDDKDFEAYDIVIKVFGNKNDYFKDFKNEWDSFIAINTVNRLDIKKSDKNIDYAKTVLSSINYNDNPLISKEYREKISFIINLKKNKPPVSIKQRITDYFLKRSNQFNYYRDNFNLMKKQNKNLKNKNAKLVKNNKKLSKKNDELTDRNENLSNDIKTLEIELEMKSKNLILNKLKNNQYGQLNIAIKSPNPSDERHWGDYFFALALKKSFEKKGFNVFIHENDIWYSHNQDIDINIVLRGVYEYVPNNMEINVMWNLYIPEDLELKEYENYDIVFIASEYYAKSIEDKVNTIVKPLLQCTDPETFFYEFDENCCEDILFVGVPRGIYREIIRDMMSTDFDVSIYGLGWERYVDERYIKGQFIPNEELHKYYSSCKILLNDHLESMKNLDFPSNRFFDALACDTLVISDKIQSAETLFEGTIITYEGVEDLNNKLEYYLNHPEEREKIVKKGKEIVLKNHTFDIRADTILDYLKGLKFD